MKPSTAKGISTFLKVLAVLTFIGGFILGIILGKNLKGDFDFAAALVYWARGLIYGMIVLAISAVIDLLLQIRGKVFNEHNDTVVQSYSYSSEDYADSDEDVIDDVLEGHAPIKVGQCELCGKENAELYSVKIAGNLVMHYKDVCAACACKPDCTLLD